MEKKRRRSRHRYGKKGAEKKLAGRPTKEMWKHAVDQTNGEEMLMSLSELSRELKRRGIYSASAKLLSEYRRIGIVHHRTREVICLRVVPIGGIHKCCVRWFRDFIEAHEGDLEDPT